MRVHRYLDGSVAIFHGPRKLADYDPRGKLKEMKKLPDGVTHSPFPPCYAIATEFKGVQLFLTKTKEEKDPQKGDAIRRDEGVFIDSLFISPPVWYKNRGIISRFFRGGVRKGGSRTAPTTPSVGPFRYFLPTGVGFAAR